MPRPTKPDETSKQLAAISAWKVEQERQAEKRARAAAEEERRKAPARRSLDLITIASRAVLTSGKVEDPWVESDASPVGIYDQEITITSHEWAGLICAAAQSWRVAPGIDTIHDLPDYGIGIDAARSVFLAASVPDADVAVVADMIEQFRHALPPYQCGKTKTSDSVLGLWHFLRQLRLYFVNAEWSPPAQSNQRARRRRQLVSIGAQLADLLAETTVAPHVQDAVGDILDVAAAVNPQHVGGRVLLPRELMIQLSDVESKVLPALAALLASGGTPRRSEVLAGIEEVQAKTGFRKTVVSEVVAARFRAPESLMSLDDAQRRAPVRAFGSGAPVWVRRLDYQTPDCAWPGPPGGVVEEILLYVKSAEYPWTLWLVPTADGRPRFARMNGQLVDIDTQVKILSERQARSWLEKNGEDSSGESFSVSSDSEYLFEKRGEMWALRYGGGELKMFPNKIGFEYLKILLESPGRPHRCVELVAAVKGERVVDESDQGLLDAEAIKSVHEELCDLEKNLEAAKSNRDLATQERCEGAIDQLRERLAKDTGLRGRSRSFKGAAEGARTQVGNAIRRAIQAISVHLPDLGKHLDVAVHLGHSPVYGEDQVSWNS